MRGALNTDIQELSKIDHMILRSITGAQAKIPIEFLYLETSSQSVSNVITVRRMSYLQVLLKRHTSEVTRKVYNAMKQAPLPGDWIHFVKSDFERVGLQMSELSITNMKKSEYKQIIKQLVWKKNFAEMEVRKETHKKVKHIEYDGKRKAQKYLVSHKFNNELSSLLFNLRCSSVNSFKDNFHSQYGQLPPCLMCKKYVDSQEHALECEGIRKELTWKEANQITIIKYNHLYGGPEEQLKITQIFHKILIIRQRLQECSLKPAYPGNNTGPR